MNQAHEQGIGYLVKRLEAKGRHVTTHVPILHDSRLVSEADVLVGDRKNGKLYLTRYEVKSGCNGRESAEKQAQTWFDIYDKHPHVVPRFVYYNSRYGELERWYKRGK